MMSDRALHLFDAFGVELEYMIVDRETLNVFPICDRLLAAMNDGEIVGELDCGQISWSNELTLHVVEMKTTSPEPSPWNLTAEFQRQIDEANRCLSQWNACLMPTAMHPWMQPEREMQLWPHDYSPVYQAYNRIFNCQGHGWANLQSTHWNLPFQGDAEFAALHSAIRLILPLLPAIAASSPLVEGKQTGFLDTRLDVYRKNSSIIPSITGLVIPEPVSTAQEYQTVIFDPMYRDIAPLDPEGLLQHEFLNSRGAIARFDRGAIEIRVLDIQECPAADLAIGSLIVNVLKALTEQRWTSRDSQKKVPTEILSDLFIQAVKVGSQAEVAPEIASHFGIDTQRIVNCREVWHHLRSQISAQPIYDSSGRQPIDFILENGTLSERLLNSVSSRPSPETLNHTYRRICDCLQNGSMFA